MIIIIIEEKRNGTMDRHIIYYFMDYESNSRRHWMNNMCMYVLSKTNEMLHMLMGLYTDEEDSCYDVAYAPYHRMCS